MHRNDLMNIRALAFHHLRPVFNIYVFITKRTDRVQGAYVFIETVLG